MLSELANFAFFGAFCGAYFGALTLGVALGVVVWIKKRKKR